MTTRRNRIRIAPALAFAGLLLGPGHLTTHDRCHAAAAGFCSRCGGPLPSGTVEGDSCPHCASKIAGTDRIVDLGTAYAIGGPREFNRQYRLQTRLAMRNSRWQMRQYVRAHRGR